MRGQAKSDIVRLVRAGLSPVTAARLARVSAAKLEASLAQDSSFADALAQAKEEATDRIEDELWRQARAGDTKAMLAILTARRPQTWRNADGTEAPQGDDALAAILAAMQARLAQPPKELCPPQQSPVPEAEGK